MAANYFSDRTMRTFAAMTLAALALACSADTGIVPMGPHRPNKEPRPLRVRTPSPPVELQVLPLRRNQECFFLDGHYVPKGDAWHWIPGKWILPPEDCYYAAPSTRYEKLDVGTTLVFRAGAWHPNSEDDPECSPVRACPAANID